MKSLVTRFVKDESGATAIEYGLIAGLISVVIIACDLRSAAPPEDRVQDIQHRARRSYSLICYRGGESKLSPSPRTVSST